jgi:hypothetical protein
MHLRSDDARSEIGEYKTKQTAHPSLPNHEAATGQGRMCEFPGFETTESPLFGVGGHNPWSNGNKCKTAQP